MNTARIRGERRWLANAFGTSLRSITDQRKFDRHILVERSGIGMDALERLLAGTRLPDLDTLFVLARALDLTPESLVARVGVYTECNALEHQVPIFFFRGPRIFRLVGADGREKVGYHVNWFDAEREAAQAPNLFRAVSVYSRTSIVEFWER